MWPKLCVGRCCKNVEFQTARSGAPAKPATGACPAVLKSSCRGRTVYQLRGGLQCYLPPGLCPHHTTTGIRRDNSVAQSLPRPSFHPHWHIHECLSSLFPVFQPCTIISSTVAAGGHMRSGAIASRHARRPRYSCRGAAATGMIFWSSTLCHRADPTLTWPALEGSPHATRGLSRRPLTLEQLRDHEHRPATERYG